MTRTKTKLALITALLGGIGLGTVLADPVDNAPNYFVAEVTGYGHPGDYFPSIYFDSGAEAWLEQHYGFFDFFIFDGSTGVLEEGDHSLTDGYIEVAGVPLTYGGEEMQVRFQSSGPESVTGFVDASQGQLLFTFEGRLSFTPAGLVSGFSNCRTPYFNVTFSMDVGGPYTFDQVDLKGIASIPNVQQLGTVCDATAASFINTNVIGSNDPVEFWLIKVTFDPPIQGS